MSIRKTILFFIFSIPFVSASPDNPCSVTYLNFNSSYKLQCPSEEKVFHLYPNEELGKNYQSLKKLYLTHSKNRKEDEAILQSIVLGHLEDELRFKYIDDEWMIADLLKQFESLTGQENEDCEEYVTLKQEVVPFVDLSIGQKEQDEMVRQMSDEKMEKEGFFSLGKLQKMTIDLQTDNDNLLHGGAQLIVKMDKKKELPSWEGDDRGYTFGEALSLNFEFDEGQIKARQYTEGYSSLASVIKNVEVCDGPGKCRQQQVITKRDEQNKRYQTFLTIDGVELELRRNHINGDIYVKMGGSLEHLTDSNKGLAQTLQTSWHKLKEKQGTVQYHNLDHMADRWRAQINTGLGIEKSYNLTNWLSVRGAIEGSIQGSTDGLNNSFVALRTEVSVNSNQLFRKEDSSLLPVLEAKFYADKKFYGDKQNYVQMGVTFYGTVYSDKSGNILYLYAGAEQLDRPMIRKYGGAEIASKQRADLNHIVGIKYQKKF